MSVVVGDKEILGMDGKDLEKGGGVRYLLGLRDYEALVPLFRGLYSMSGK